METIIESALIVSKSLRPLRKTMLRFSSALGNAPVSTASGSQFNCFSNLIMKNL